jgi:hypothetical protein
MPRNLSGVFSLPAGSIVVDGIDDILASQHNSPLQDIESDMNAARPVVAGGTGATTAGDARTNLGLGTIATQNANAVAITGGAVSGITDLAVADGGTGASTAGDARTNLGAAASARTITAGDGLTGGGDLSADRFFSVVAGDGISVGPSSVAVDSTVVRTTGTQSIGGVKGFDDQIFLNDVAVFATTIQQGDADGVTLGNRGLICTIGTNNSLLTLQCLAATGNDELMFRVVRGATARMRVLADGDVENTNNSYSGISDERLKQDIVPAGPQLEEIRQLQVKKYRFKDEPDGPLQIGLIAQEVLGVKPGLVREDQDGRMSVVYSVLVPILLKAVQELADRVDALENGVG